MTTFDFSECKTPEDVQRVLDGKEGRDAMQQAQEIKKLLEDLNSEVGR